MYERQICGAKMSDQERGQFVQKAKLDRIAYDAAQLLSLGEPTKAATLIGAGITSASKDQLEMWFRHYAIARFKVAGGAVEDFLNGVPAANVAL